MVSVCVCVCVCPCVCVSICVCAPILLEPLPKLRFFHQMHPLAVSLWDQHILLMMCVYVYICVFVCVLLFVYVVDSVGTLYYILWG